MPDSWNHHNAGEKIGELAQFGCAGLCALIAVFALLAWITGNTPW